MNKSIWISILIAIGFGAIILISIFIKSDELVEMLKPSDLKTGRLEIYTIALRNYGLTIAAILGVIFATWRTIIAQNTLDHNRETETKQSQNERFNTAVEQLSSNILSVRLGGIYTLSALKNEEFKDGKLPKNAPMYEQSMKILCAFIRHPLEDEYLDRESPNKEQLRPDVQEALHQVANRTEQQNQYDIDKQNHNNLSYANLSFAEMIKYNLKSFNLNCVNLASSNCAHTDFSNTNCIETCFKDSRHLMTNFTKANLTGANLSNSDFSGSDFTETELFNTQFSNTILPYTKFNNAVYPKDFPPTGLQKEIIQKFHPDSNASYTMKYKDD